MRTRFKPHIKALERHRTSVGRDFEGLRLDRNERVHPLPPEVVRDAMAQFTGALIAAHPESAPLYARIAAFLGVAEDRIYLLNGITEGIHHLYFTLAGPGDNTVVLDPTYPMYAVYARLNGVQYRPFRYGEDLRPDWSSLERALDDDTAIVAVANPNLPLESAFGRDDIRRLADHARRHGAALVVDEAYHHFGAESVVDLMDEIDNLIVMRTFSKAFGLASARIGYMVGRPDVIDYVSKTRSLVESNTYSMGLAAYMLDHPEIMAAHVADVKAGAARLQDGLTRLGLRWHGGHVTNGLLIFLDGRGTVDDCLRWMAERRIYVRGAFSPPFDTCVRVSIGRPEDMDIFLAELGSWLESTA